MATTEKRLIKMSDPQWGGARSVLSAEPQLFARRITTRYDPPNGADITFAGLDHEGHFFYCKGDKPRRPIRATEFIFTRLADRLGIRVPESAVLEYQGETFFGSRNEASSLGDFAARDFLTTAHTNELGQRAEFPGTYLAQMLAYDLFIGNVDRSVQNFLVTIDGGMQRLCAIDFAAANLEDLTTDRFPVAHSQTAIIGRRLRSIHGRFDSASVEMIDRISALPKAAFDHIVGALPDDWLTQDEQGALHEVWGSPGFSARLNALRTGIINGTLV